MGNMLVREQLIVSSGTGLVIPNTCPVKLVFDANQPSISIKE
jgi:hypothetical protein